ncbi:TPA: D-alanyl-D-alanine carboxypeptidase [Streptococcus equi subsp. zooepidemicus]|nr:D-alanyl-D-alanine carboxypeptidase [Streptococcus equi subsp. zooepidemicus]
MKKLIVILAALMCLITNTSLAEDFSVNSRQAIAVEMTTGKILYAKEAQQKAPIASLTKLLTVYLVLKEIKAGRLQWDSQVILSEYALQLATDPDISNPAFEQRPYTIKELVESSLIISANSSAVALAEHIAGSEPTFVDMMKKQLEAWGIRDYLLVNASGLNNSMLKGHLYPGSQPDDENQMTARDLALIAQQLIQDFPELLTISSQPQLKWGEKDLPSSNLLLAGREMGRAGVDGLKTGTTSQAGQTMITTAVQDNMRVISVILHADQSDTDERARFVETNRLLDYCFDSYALEKLVAQNQVLPERLIVKQAAKQRLRVKASQTLTVVRPKDQTELSYSLRIKDKALKVPIRQNKKVGTLIYQDPKLIDSGYLAAPPAVAIVSAKSIPEKGKLSKLFDFFQKVIGILINP